MNYEKYYFDNKQRWNQFSEMVLLPDKQLLKNWRGQMQYEEFLDRKSQKESYQGFDPLWMPEFLYDFQQALVEWSLKKGKSAIFADCGLGKTPMQLVWAENIVRKTNRPVLILTPLAVSLQTELEAKKFDIEAKRLIDGNFVKGINIVNYEKLHFFNPNDFAGVVCDESSILKNFNGVRKNEITQFMKKLDYRLLCTATAAPNDYIELGTSSEALGELGNLDMLERFFHNTENENNPQWNRPKWEIKAHGADNFWRWVSSWARALRKPSDLGFDDTRFILPKLYENEIVVENTRPLEGELFIRKAKTMDDQRNERKNTLQERCEKVAELVEPHDFSVVWCQLNAESDLLAKMIPNSVNIQGSDLEDKKERNLIAFSKGEIKTLITKPKIGAFGMNWQHCNHMTYFPSHSYEQYYQGTRRCWRFGQTRDVHVDIVTTEGELGVFNNLQRKSVQAVEMFEKLVLFMNQGINHKRNLYQSKKVELPSWL